MAVLRVVPKEDLVSAELILGIGIGSFGSGIAVIVGFLHFVENPLERRQKSDEFSLFIWERARRNNVYYRAVCFVAPMQDLPVRIRRGTIWRGFAPRGTQRHDRCNRAARIIIQRDEDF